MAHNVGIRRSEYVTNPVLRYIGYGVIALLLSVVHVVFLRFMQVSSVTPDLLLIFTVFIAIYEGQFTGMIAGFLCGLLFDAVSTDVIGTNALAKTLAGFVAGYFYHENHGVQFVGSFNFLLVIALCGFVHNLVYNFFFIRPMQVSFWIFFLQYGLAATLYTTVTSLFLMLYINRRRD
ncbi:MAG: rod shape-determining protein MreD [Ignavibacteria bacterium]|nr:rod shape-determining protein MreD [Ignavibacteria bacterium]